MSKKDLLPAEVSYIASCRKSVMSMMYGKYARNAKHRVSAAQYRELLHQILAAWRGSR